MAARIGSPAPAAIAGQVRALLDGAVAGEFSARRET
jgi:hypothetical protein